jgi:hypothetical protein
MQPKTNKKAKTMAVALHSIFFKILDEFTEFTALNTMHRIQCMGYNESNQMHWIQCKELIA